MRLAVLALVAACHGPALPQVPGKGGPAWIELQSEHFTVWTDASRGAATELVREMEHLRQVVLGVGFSGPRMEGRSFVIALRDSEEVGVFLPEAFAAYAESGGALRQSVIVLPVDANEDNKELVTHELVHVIAFNVIRNQPRWFAEGLANFFASVNIDPDRASGDVGKPLPNVLRRLRQTPPTPSAKMFACNSHACMDDMFYATAWAIFAYLANTHPRELLAYAARLDALPPEDAARAWTETFPSLTTDKLDHEVRKWLAYGKHTVWKFNVKLQQWPITERPLRDADVYAARAYMRHAWLPPDAPAPAELVQALAEDPAHLIANLVAYARAKKIAPEAARLVAKAHPEDWRAWWLVGESTGWSGDEARTAWERACVLLAKQPSPWAPTGNCAGR